MLHHLGCGQLVLSINKFNNEITGEEYDDFWGGDLSQIDFNYDDTGSAGYTSKEY